MALGNLRRNESALAESALDPGLLGRALKITAHETGSFEATLLPLAAISSFPAGEHYFRDRWHLKRPTPRQRTLLMKTGLADHSEHAFVDAITLQKISHNEGVRS
jgi:hypothetical protein